MELELELESELELELELEAFGNTHGVSYDLAWHGNGGQDIHNK